MNSNNPVTEINYITQHRRITLDISLETEISKKKNK